MPGLIRGVARTAAIAGTATVVSNGVSRRQRGRWAAKDQQAADAQAYQEQQQAPPPPAYAPPPQEYAAPPAPAAAEEAPASDMDAKLAQLKQLGELKTAGVLTDEEFEEQKARILGS